MKWTSWGLLCLASLTLALHSLARGYGHRGHFHAFSYSANSRNIGRLSSRSYAHKGLGQYYTHGHTRRNGSYVRGHYATTPNQTKWDNWSTRGNYNPYTGHEGTKSPY